MRLHAKGAAVLAAGCAALAVCAAPALAAPVTVKTDAGTTCTINADKTVGAGLLVRPVNFTGDIHCSLANPATIPTVVSGGLALTSSLPLGLGAAGGQPNQPPKPAPPGFEGGYMCDLAPDADCGAAGQTTGLPLATYTVVFGVAITAPAGEAWTLVPSGCELSENTVSCSSRTEAFKTT